MKPMLEYRVSARRVDAHGSVASTKEAEVILDTDINGRPDAFNPAELFLAAIAACMIKGIERVTPMLKFNLRGVEVKLHGVRQDARQKWSLSTTSSSSIPMRTIGASNSCTLNVRKFGTISNTAAAALKLEGVIRRKG